MDNCPDTHNPDQSDSDGDGVGDVYVLCPHTTIQVTDNSIEDSYYQISSAGLIVWSGFDYRDVNGRDYDIYLYDGSTIINISNNSLYDDNPQHDRTPQINSSGYIVWVSEPGSSNNEIYFYNGVTIINISNSPLDDEHPRINDDGYIVWQGLDDNGNDDDTDNDWDIYLYDGSSVINISDV